MKTYLFHTAICILFFVAGYLVHVNLTQGLELKEQLTTNTGTIVEVSYISDHQSIVWMRDNLDNLEIKLNNKPVRIESVDPVETREGPTWAVCIRY